MSDPFEYDDMDIEICPQGTELERWTREPRDLGIFANTGIEGARLYFPNGYGLSIVRPMIYGSGDGLLDLVYGDHPDSPYGTTYEVALIMWYFHPETGERDYELIYDHDWGDVKARQDIIEVRQLAREVGAYKPTLHRMRGI